MQPVSSKYKASQVSKKESWNKYSSNKWHHSKSGDPGKLGWNLRKKWLCPWKVYFQSKVFAQEKENFENPPNSLSFLLYLLIQSTNLPVLSLFLNWVFDYFLERQAVNISVDRWWYLSSWNNRNKTGNVTIWWTEKNWHIVKMYWRKKVYRALIRT